MQTFLPEDSVCIGWIIMRLRFQFGIYLYECVLKKVSNGQKFTGSKFVIKTSPQCNSIGTTPEPSLTCNLKVANKDCGTWLVLKHFYCVVVVVFFFLPITVLHSLIIAFPRFWTRFTVPYFSVSSWRSTALHYGRPPYILDFYQIYFLASLLPHKPHIL